MDENKNLPDALIQSIKSPASKEVLKELAEAGMDQAFKDGFFKDLPIIGTVIGLFKTGAAVRDALFVKRVGRFLLALDAVPLSVREGFVRKIDTEPEEKKKVSESLLLLLDRMDDMDKPQILARLFVPYLYGHIDLDTFKRLSVALDRASRWALSKFRTLVELASNEGAARDIAGMDPIRSAINELQSTGLLVGGSYVPMEPGYAISDIGKLMDEYAGDIL